jgi:hypothetical protein
MAKLINPIYPFGAHCEALSGEVTESTKQYLIETNKATEADFEVEEVKETKSKK